MVPAAAALLSLLTLKLLDKERRSHIDDFNFDEALGLFAGLNILPKKSFATDYSYRTGPDQQRRPVARLGEGPGAGAVPRGRTPSRWTSIPSPTGATRPGWSTTTCRCRGKAGPSVLTFFALEQESRCLCYANANLTRADQPGEVMRFVEFWHDLTGHDPEWLYFDSKVTTYPELSRLNQRGIHFVTIRRRGASLVRKLLARPAGVDGRRDRHPQAVSSARSVTSRSRCGCAATRGRSARSPWPAWAASSPRCS